MTARPPKVAATAARSAAPRGLASGSPKLLAAWSLATWFGCGLSPIAPGTVGTIGALPLYVLLRDHGPLAILGAAVLVTVIGTWASNVVVADSGESDPQRIVIDEVAGVLVALAAAPPTWAGVAVSVALFRVFDITKPFPARRAERLEAGWGVMADDIVAGVWAALVAAVLARVLPIA